MVQLFVNNQETTLKDLFLKLTFLPPLQVLEASLGSTSLGVGMYYLVTRNEGTNFTVKSEVSVPSIEEEDVQHFRTSGGAIRHILAKYSEWAEELSSAQEERIAQDPDVEDLLSYGYTDKYPEIEVALLLGEDAYRIVKHFINVDCLCTKYGVA